LAVNNVKSHCNNENDIINGNVSSRSIEENGNENIINNENQ